MNDKDRLPNYPPGKIEIAPFRQLLILLGLACMGILLAGLSSFFMITLTPGASMESISAGNKEFLEIAKWMQAIGTFFLFALPALLFNLFLRPRKDFFNFKRKRPALLWTLAILMAFCAIAATDLFSSLNQWIPLSPHLRKVFQAQESAYNEQMLHMLDLDSLGNYLISLILIALLPALFEELFFRGTLQQVFLKWFKKPFWAILVTSIIFSAIHMSYFGFLPRVFLGMLMGYVFYYGKNIWLNIIIHFINNAVVVTMLYLWTRDNRPIEQALNQHTPLYLEIIGIVVLAGIFSLFIRTAKKLPPISKLT